MVTGPPGARPPPTPVPLRASLLPTARAYWVRAVSLPARTFLLHPPPTPSVAFARRPDLRSAGVWSLRSFLIALLIFCGCCTSVATAGAAPDAATPRVALVIGNSDYEHLSDLASARNDARAVADALVGLGFEVVLGT